VGAIMMKNFWGPILLKSCCLAVSFGIFIACFVQGFPPNDLLIIFVILSALNIHNWMTVYALKIEDNEVYLSRFMSWKKLHLSHVNIVDLNGRSLSLYGELNILRRVVIPVLWRIEATFDLKNELEKIISTDPRIKLVK
jgi:hypothetical protein